MDNVGVDLNPGAAMPTVQLLAKQFQAKFSTKRECYNFLTLDCKAYLPHYQTVTIYFVSRFSDCIF